MAAIASVRAPIVARASGFTGRRVQCSATNGTSNTSMRATWMPGSTPPSYLDGSMPWCVSPLQKQRPSNHLRRHARERRSRGKGLPVCMRSIVRARWAGKRESGRGSDGSCPGRVKHKHARLDLLSHLCIDYVQSVRGVTGEGAERISPRRFVRASSSSGDRVGTSRRSTGCIAFNQSR